MSQAANAKAPVIGTVLRALQTVFVERTARASTQLCKDQIRARAQPGSGYPQVLVFPTRASPFPTAS